MSIEKAVMGAYAKMVSRNWDTMYWAIDVHDTCVRGNYSTSELPTEFFPKAKKVLQHLSNRSDSVLILFTCSHPTEIDQYLEFFGQNGINFKYVNENPEVPNTALGCFDKKFYTNIYVDDKAGFEPETDWSKIDAALTVIDMYNNRGN